MRPAKRAKKMTEDLTAQQQAGTHNPATKCACGTMRTPGQPHTKGDTGPAPKGIGAQTCNN
jgi:hypothetical protein